MYAGLVKISAEDSLLSTQADLQFVFRTTAPSERVHQGTKIMEVGGC